MHLLREARADPQYVGAARLIRCEACEDGEDRPQTTKTTVPCDYVFKCDVGLDLLEVKDSEGTRFSCFNIADLGTTYHQVILVHVGGSQASSQSCLDAFVDRWIKWAGWPRVVTWTAAHATRASPAVRLPRTGC